MNDAHLPPTGEIEVVPPDEAAEIVEEIAGDPALARTGMLIVLDIDGTILLGDETFSPGVVDAIEDAHRAGHEVMLATGRSWDGTDRVLGRLGIHPEYVVCSNGAVIMRHVDGEHYARFRTETFDPRQVLEMIRDNVPDAHYMVELADGSRRVTEPLDDWNMARASIVPFEQLSEHPVCRVVVVSPSNTETDFLEMVERIGLSQVSYAIGWTAWLDIAPRGVDKGTALEWVRRWRDVDPSRVLVIGDGRNDVGMFRWAREHGGRAVAMAQGPQEVHDAAGESTTSVEDGGVAAVLRRL